jgi:hypothetical protein
MPFPLYAILVALSVVACIEICVSFLEWVQENWYGPHPNTKPYQWKRMCIIALVLITTMLLFKWGQP